MILINVGGMWVVKYGMMCYFILGVEVVLVDGIVINLLKKIIKDNFGFDFK